MKKKILNFVRGLAGTQRLQREFTLYRKNSRYENRRFELAGYLIHDTEPGVTKERYADHDIIVSLTTYGKRIHDVSMTIESVMQQTMKANKVVLWLDHSFEHQRLPQSLVRQRERGLEIAFCTDIRSYKKLVPAFCRYPDDAVITVDDDALYDPCLLESLVTAYINNPSYIYCHRYHKMKFDEDGSLLPYEAWDWQCDDKTPSHLNFATGVGGVLYPPHSLDEEVKNEKVFMDICKYADDVWYKAMAIKKGTLVKKVYSRSDISEDYILNDGVQDIGLHHVNVKGEHLNDTQIKAVFSRYGLYDKLR